MRLGLLESAVVHHQNIAETLATIKRCHAHSIITASIEAAMDDVTILNDWNPSEETLRRWAFDTTLLLSDQDEDLALHRREYLPVLIPLADDPACPKADYILSCIDFYLMFVVLRGTEDDLAQVRQAAELARCAKQAKLHAWAGLQDRRLRYREGLGPTSREQVAHHE